ncbi:LysM peptidoglycan-binding domain-containing protein [Anoxybacteroides amylolyticum]|uniref:LysM domain protein n=1 Tax=Anoxybacteroides amylolyticum TaxID=294699 RepID=A0A160F766_9BACL|nr:LysM domain-containing protein [Anoxybacillus amylolyticus]ANB61833.1 lysM domain protein [Anoxybacillus amylolyticus]
MHDQAEQLRKQMEEKKEPDVLSLPPRSEVHKSKEKKTKWKIKYPLVRLLLLFFILLPFVIFAIYYMGDKRTIAPIKKSESYEPIAIEEKARTKEEPPVSSVPETKENKPTGSSEKATSDKQVITHVVQANETLFSIAMHYYGTKDGMDIIKHWNHLQSAQLYKGQVLQIPVVELTK